MVRPRPPHTQGGVIAARCNRGGYDIENLGVSGWCPRRASWVCVFLRPPFVLAAARHPAWTCQPSPQVPLHALLRHAPAGAHSHPSENCTYHYNHLYPPLTHLREDLLPTRLISERQTRPPSELELLLWLFLAGHRLDSTCTVRIFLALSRPRRPQAADTLADTRPGVITRDLPDGCQLVRRE